MSNTILAASRCALTGMALLTLAAGCAAEGRSDWDRDGDGVVTRTEFRSGRGTEGAFEARDRDRDGRLSRGEFAERGHGTLYLDDGNFADWDVNDDDWVDDSETLDGYFDSYDDDGDGALAGAERDRLIGELERYPSFD